MRRELRGLTPLDVEDILGDATAAILQSWETIDEPREMKFTAWAMGVFRNKKSDFLRKKYQWREGMETLKHEWECHNPQSDSEMRILEQIDFDRLMKTLGATADGKNCSTLFLLQYEAFQRGETEKDVAKRINIGYDAYRKRLSRCRAAIIALLRLESEK